MSLFGSLSVFLSLSHMIFGLFLLLWKHEADTHLFCFVCFVFCLIVFVVQIGSLDLGSIVILESVCHRHFF